MREAPKGAAVGWRGRSPRLGGCSKGAQGPGRKTLDFSRFRPAFRPAALRRWVRLAPWPQRSKFRPRPGRANIVVTRQRDWQAQGAQVAHAVADALALCPPDSHPWVIGGAELYALALPLATRVVVTDIHADFDGDAFAPTLGPEWREASRVSHTAASGLGFDVVNWVRTE